MKLTIGDCRLAIRVVLVTAVVGFAASAPLYGQNDHSPADSLRPTTAAEKEAETEERKTAQSAGGVWPTPKLMNSLLARWADQIGEEYELGPDQRVKVREQVQQRWSPFLEENREAIQPLVTEFLELRMELEPPAKEAVQSWAERAMPMYDRFRKQVTGTNGDLRQVLTAKQRVRFEMDAMQFAAGMQFAEGKLRQWQSGEVDPKEFWEPPASARADRKERWEQRRARRTEWRRAREERASDAQAMSPPGDQVAVEMDLWEKYVAEFIERYGLDEGQKTTVQSLLTEMKERATAHRDRRREEIEQLEARIQKGGADVKPDEIKEELIELYGPIDDLFAELQRRMEPIPTSEQKARAEATDKPLSH